MRVAQRKEFARAGEIRQIGIGFARENGIIGQPCNLGTFDFGIPVGAFHQSNLNFPPGLGSQIINSVDQPEAPFIIGLYGKPEPIPLRADPAAWQLRK